MVSSSWTDGTQQLPVAVAHRRTTVLWTWHRPRLLVGACLCRIDSSRRVCSPDSCQRLVVTVVPFRSLGVDLADADIRELLQDTQKLKTLPPLRILGGLQRRKEGEYIVWLCHCVLDMKY